MKRILSNPWRERRMKEQREAMIEAAWKLPSFPGWKSRASPEDVHFLSGEKYWHETAFCFWTLCRFSPRPLRIVIHDDGTFTKQSLSHLRNLFPHVQFHPAKVIERRLDEHLPQDAFPTLREWRIRQPLLRKITDLHAGSSGKKMLLDSDMIFYRQPKFLLEWLRSGNRPLYMVDVKNAYGFSHELRSSLVQKPIHDRINIGIFGLNSEKIDFPQLEIWLTSLLEYEPAPYNMTQGITSMMLAGVDCQVAPKDEYIVLPPREEVENPEATLHHFVAESREWYYEWGWKHARQIIEEHA